VVIIRYPKGIWSSDATGVATVDQNGLVTAVAGAGGTATISYTMGTGAELRTYGSVSITVKKPSTDPPAISGSTSICTGGSTTLTSDGSSNLGTDAVQVWYQGGCGDDAFDQNWNTQPYTTTTTTLNSNVNGILNLTSTNNDPNISMPNLGSFAASTYKYINIRYKTNSSTGVQIYYSKNTTNSDLSESQVVNGTYNNNGSWNIISLDMSSSANWTGTINGWRFDWATTNAATVEIDFISLSKYPIIAQGTSITVSPTVNTTYATKIKGYCNNTACKSATVTVTPQIVAPVLNVKTPNAASVCAGTNVNATITAGSGGTSASDTYEYRTNGTGSWVSYTSGTNLSTTGLTQVEIRVSRSAGTGSGCTATGSTTIASWTINPTPTAGVIAIADAAVCPGSASSITSTTPGTGTGAITYRWESSTTDAASGFTTVAGETNATLSPTISATTWFRRVTIATSGVACESVPSNVVQLFASADNTGVLASATSTKTCLVNDANWHYFRNSTGQIIAAVNSQGKDLGNVTITVTIESGKEYFSGDFYDSPKHGNGGLGRNGVCLGLPELSMRRWYEISSTNPIPNDKSTLVKFFFTSDDYSNYTSEILRWLNKHPGMNYGLCYGIPSGGTNLAVSRNTANDVPAVGGVAFSITGTPFEYNLTRDAFSDYRFHTNGGIGQPLPVELVSFTGWNQGSVNQLQWITASELNTDKFEVEKSTVSGVWNTIGSKTAAGNSNIQRTYDFTDIQPVIGDNYYRLKMIDLDGTFKYSNTINIPISEAITNGFAGVYPNPTGGELNVDIQSVGLYDTKVSVYDVLGKTIFEKPVTIVRGMNKLQFNFNQFAKGTYILRFADAQGTLHSTKFVKD
jgi:hypothetical protein